MVKPDSTTEVESTAAAAAFSSLSKRENRGRPEAESSGMMKRVGHTGSWSNLNSNQRKEEEKEGTDAKQLRPKADQAVSLVSAVPALVGNIGLLLKRIRIWRLREGSVGRLNHCVH